MLIVLYRVDHNREDKLPPRGESSMPECLSGLTLRSLCTMLSVYGWDKRGEIGICVHSTRMLVQGNQIDSGSPSAV